MGKGLLTTLESTGVTTTESVAVLMMEIDGVGKVLSGSVGPGRQALPVQLGAWTLSLIVVMSLALIT